MNEENSQVETPNTDTPQEQSEVHPRSFLQKLSLVIFFALLILSLAGSGVVALMELPPASWINNAQDAMFDMHFPMIGFIVVMIISVALAMGIALGIIRCIRSYMARKGIPWVDENGNIIEG